MKYLSIFIRVALLALGQSPETETKWPPFPDNIFKWIFLNEIIWISIKMSLKFVPRGPINNISALVQIMAWRRPGDKPLSEPMMVSSLTHICVTRPQWVNLFSKNKEQCNSWGTWFYKTSLICRPLTGRIRFRDSHNPSWAKGRGKVH